MKKSAVIERPFALFMLVVVGMAALLGPVNLWAAFRRRNAMRVIWTTPALSAGLSLLVGVGIVFSDGFGGHGRRSLWVWVMPEMNLHVKRQEQVSRTGVLLSDAFKPPPGTLLHPVQVHKRERKDHRPYREAPDGTRAGDWFANRRIQGQVLEQVRGSRGRVRWVEGSPDPAVVSTLEASLATLVVVDESGGYWRAENVTPGRETPLRRLPRGEAAAFLTSLRTREGAHAPYPPGGRESRGWFYAVAEEGVEDAFIETLPSIRWKDEAVRYAGPLTGKGGA